MSTDLQCVFPQNLVELSSVQLIYGVAPLTLDVIGKDFRSVDEVRVNDVLSPSVVVMSPTRLLAQVPDSVKGGRVTSVTVLSSQLTLNEKTLLRFRLGISPKKVSGLLRLVQLFVKVLFTTPGRDIFAPKLGGGALRNLGRSFSRAQGSGLVADFVIAVQQTSKQIISIQARDPAIPREERLLAAKMISADFNRQEEALVAGVELTNQTGRSALAQIMA